RGAKREETGTVAARRDRAAVTSGRAVPPAAENGVRRHCDVLYPTRVRRVIRRSGVARSAVVSAMPRIARAARDITDVTGRTPCGRHCDTSDSLSASSAGGVDVAVDTGRAPAPKDVNAPA